MVSSFVFFSTTTRGQDVEVGGFPYVKVASVVSLPAHVDDMPKCDFPFRNQIEDPVFEHVSAYLDVCLYMAVAVIKLRTRGAYRSLLANTFGSGRRSASVRADGVANRFGLEATLGVGCSHRGQQEKARDELHFEIVSSRYQVEVEMNSLL